MEGGALIFSRRAIVLLPFESKRVILLDDTLWERTFAEYERGSTSVDDAESFVAEPFRRALAGALLNRTPFH